MDGRRRNLIVFVGLVLLFTALQTMFASRGEQEIPYSTFEQYLEAGQVEKVTVSGDEISGELKAPQNGVVRFSTERVPLDLADKLKEKGVEFRARHESSFWPLIMSWLLPLFLLFGMWFFVFRRMANRAGGGGLLAIGKSKARVYMEKDTRVTFNDVAGVDEAKQELEEVVHFLRDPLAYGRLGARMPKGIMLVGPPGTGKTLLARAVAGEAGVPFLSISGSEFVEMFVGVGAARVRDLFEEARRLAPCIIFVDELDALGRARGNANMPGGHDEKEQTLNQLLVELDGFETTAGIVLLAATNRPEILDPALLRAGRFDRQVLVDRPDRSARAAIAKVHLRKVKAAEDVEPDVIAALTPGFTGADVANLVNEAALAATRRGREAVQPEDFTEAVERLVAGLERKSRILNPAERKRVAYHELGHAIAAAATGSDPVQKISIIPRGIGALGYTLQRPLEDRYLMTGEELKRRIVVLLGGRAAEDLIFGELSTGAADDLAKATDIARNMVTRYGLVPALGHATYDSDAAPMLGSGGAIRTRLYSEATAERIDQAVNASVDEGFDRARAVLERHRAVLEEGAEKLLELETLDGDVLSAILDKVRPIGGPKAPGVTPPIIAPGAGEPGIAAEEEGGDVGGQGSLGDAASS
ncbi:MAG: ATP-dependent metallopeptidase FtsH/Yme1/Tma family protein [Deltaproteobacteria bacterium]|nr:ATP-dependent metallopeptidase FtsH/Yme1/Tma family protein [Deltaproteobacteria bacterium]